MSSSFNAPRGPSTASKLGHGIAKVLRIDLQPPSSPVLDKNAPLDNGETYVEHDPTVGEWLSERRPTPQGAWNFFVGLFPFVNWIGKYNKTWFIGDVVAGVTVGTVVVPQSSMLSVPYLKCVVIWIGKLIMLFSGLC